MKLIYAICLLLVACTAEPTAEALPKAAVEQAVSIAEPTIPPPPAEVKIDPYEGWETWCEELEQSNCFGGHGSPCPPSRTGRERICYVPPGLRQEGNSGKCTPIYLGRTPREEKEAMQVRKDRIRTVIEDVCTPPKWWRWGQGHEIDKECWKHKRGKLCERRCNPEKLHRFFRVIAKRESDWRMTKVHNLNPDVEAASAAWLRHCANGTYEGNPHLGACTECEPGDPFLKSDPDVVPFACRSVPGQEKKWRPSLEDREDSWKRWRAYGLYGQNAALWVLVWDEVAPPELLCRDVESTEMALRRLRKTWRKFVNGVTCNGEKVFHEPTWANLHAAVWGGASACREDLDTRMGHYLRRRMAKVKLDPDEVVTLEMLGTPVPREGQNEWANALRGRLGPV